MGTKVLLRNACAPHLSIEVEAVEDATEMHLCVPEAVRARLGLEAISVRQMRGRDGLLESVPYIGPIEVRIANRLCFVGALVAGQQVVLGSIPMQDREVARA
jgi:hypothetical protein